MFAFVGCDNEENEGEITGGGGSGTLDGTVWISNADGEKSVLAFTDGVYYLYMDVNEETGDVYGGAMTGTYSCSGSSIKMSITWIDGAEDGETPALKISGTVSGSKIDLKLSAKGQSMTLPNFVKDPTNYGVGGDTTLVGTTWVSTYYGGETHTLIFNEDGKTFSLSMVGDNYHEYTYEGYYRYDGSEGVLFIDEAANELAGPPMPLIWPWKFGLQNDTALVVYCPFADDGRIPNFIKQ